MNMVRRKFFKILLLIALTLGFHAPLHAQPIRVVTTIPDLADMTRQIGRELVEVESLTRGVEYMHAVPVKPSFVPKLNRADLLVLMGLDMEVSWLPALLEVANNPRILPGQPGYVDCSEGVSVLEASTVLDRSEGDVHPKGNPHYNLDPVNGKMMAKNIAAGLSRNFPQHRRAFEENLKAYLAELDRWIARWEEQAAPLKGTKIVVYHQDWSYFAKRYGLELVGTIEIKPGIEPTPNHLVSLVQKMQREKAQIILYGPQSNRFPQRLASQTGASVVRLQSTAGAHPETETYIKFIDYNIRTLVDALRRS